MPNNITATGSKKNRLYKDTVCPFCSLLCDDIQIENRQNRLKVINTRCKQSRDGFQKTSLSGSCQVNDKTVSLEQAIKAAARILKKSSRPLLSGLGTDVEGSRACILLAEKLGAYIDHMGSDAAQRNYRVLRDKGYILTTLAEVKNRADLIIFVGTDAVSDGYSRFFERYVWNQHSMFDLDTSNREIVYIGDNLNTRPGKSPNGQKAQYIKCPQENIGEIFGVLNAMLSGHEFKAKRIAGVSSNTLNALVEKIQDADYGVVVWAPSSLSFPHADLTVQTICEFITDRNTDSRFAGLPLMGDHGGISASNVATWQSGYPLRMRYLNGFPEYDPEAYGTERLLKNQEIDALLWLSTFGADMPIINKQLPTIVMADSRTKLSRQPDVFIPVGTTGLDHGGHMIRTDSVVSMALSPVRDTQLPSVHTVVSEITKLLG